MIKTFPSRCLTSEAHAPADASWSGWAESSAEVGGSNSRCAEPCSGQIEWRMFLREDFDNQWCSSSSPRIEQFILYTSQQLILWQKMEQTSSDHAWACDMEPQSNSAGFAKTLFLKCVTHLQNLTGCVALTKHRVSFDQEDFGVFVSQQPPKTRTQCSSLMQGFVQLFSQTPPSKCYSRGHV